MFWFVVIPVAIYVASIVMLTLLVDVMRGE